MRDSIYRITLDMHDVASQVQIAVKQYDTARSLYITLMENGKPFQISEGCRAILSIASPESTVIVDDCEIRMKDSVIIYEFNNLTARYIGINECDLKLYDLENDLLTSPKFTILVNENIFNDGGEHGIDHNLTLNRDKNDQHPISSITGLEEALKSKTDDHDHELLSLRVDNIESIISDKWDSTVTYAVDAYVIYDNALWKCKSQNSAQIPAEGDYWTKCSVSSEITGLSSEITGLSSEITGLSSDVTGLSSDVTGLSSDVAALNSHMSNILKANVYSTSALRCTTKETPVERDLSSVDLHKVNAIGVQVTIPDIGRHFCFIPKVNTTTAPRSTFSYIGTTSYYTCGYVEVDWTNKKLRFCIQSLQGWTVDNIYVSAIYFFQ